MKKTTLKEHREDHDITQKEVANTLHLTIAAYSRKEKGTRAITLEEAKKIAEFFNVPFEEIF